MPVENLRPKEVIPTGLICPKDPKRTSTDPNDPPTHLHVEVLEVDVHDAKTAQEAAKKRTAKLRCVTCEHEWTVKPWPPQVAGPPRPKPA